MFDRSCKLRAATMHPYNQIELQFSYVADNTSNISNSSNLFQDLFDDAVLSFIILQNPGRDYQSSKFYPLK